MDKENPALKAQGLHNDFSEQEKQMTASMMPPSFSLLAGSASEAQPHSSQITEEEQFALQELGLLPGMIDSLSPAGATQLIAIRNRFESEQWNDLLDAFLCSGFELQFVETLIGFYENLEWNIDRLATSVAVLAQMPYNTVSGQRKGHVELVKQDAKAGLRAVIPFVGFGGNMILDPYCTSTVLGRSVESTSKEEFLEEMNMPRGTNYFRFQQNMKVGKNEGGGNVLDVEDKTWSWALNNAWLQAAVDRRDRIRFISDPTKRSTLYKRGGTIKDGLTVTGMELGVLMHRGMAPDVATGEVKAGYVPLDEETEEKWREIEEQVKHDGTVHQIDAEAYDTYLHGCNNPALALKQYRNPEGDIVVTQTNFFGGSGDSQVAA